MKKMMITLLFTLCITTVSCTNNTDNNKVNTNNDEINIEENESNEEVEKDEKKINILNSTELNEELNKQPMIITETNYIVQDAELKELYPDVLNVIFQNNSGVDVKNVVLGFVAWDENNMPVKITAYYDYYGGDYYIEGPYNDVNMINGSIFGEGVTGLSLSPNNKIAKFKCIIVSYTDFGGNTWNNPLLDNFKEVYVDKKLVE